MNFVFPSSIMESSPAGRCAVFVDLKNGRGLKLFEDEETRNISYERQTLAAEHGLGPLTYEFCEADIDGSTHYGYVTETVEVLNPETHFNGEGDYSTPSELEEEIDELCLELLTKINFDFEDCHVGNIGRKNGKMVCIDFE